MEKEKIMATMSICAKSCRFEYTLNVLKSPFESVNTLPGTVFRLLFILNVMEFIHTQVDQEHLEYNATTTFNTYGDPSYDGSNQPTTTITDDGYYYDVKGDQPNYYNQPTTSNDVVVYDHYDIKGDQPYYDDGYNQYSNISTRFISSIIMSPSKSMSNFPSSQMAPSPLMPSSPSSPISSSPLMPKFPSSPLAPSPLMPSYPSSPISLSHVPSFPPSPVVPSPSMPSIPSSPLAPSPLMPSFPSSQISISPVPSFPPSPMVPSPSMPSIPSSPMVPSPSMPSIPASPIEPSPGLPSPPPSPGSSNSNSSGGSTQGFANQMLDKHNELRAQHGSPPLELSPEINSYAQEWADNLAQSETLQHRDTHEYGENLYQGNGENDGAIPTQSWYDEVNQYQFGSNSPGMAGHFTQLVWKASTKLGVGKATSASGKTYVVANYDPPGNVAGQYADNVLPKSS